MKWVTRKNANVDRIACPCLMQSSQRVSRSLTESPSEAVNEAVKQSPMRSTSTLKSLCSPHAGRMGIRIHGAATRLRPSQARALVP